MQKLEVVGMVKINGVWVDQNELDPEEFNKLIEKKLDDAMRNIGFERKKTA